MHGLEQHNGQTAYVGAREDAWHQLGTTLPSEFTVEQAMEYAHLGGWNVRKTPNYTMTDNGFMEIENSFAVVRDNPWEPGKIDILGKNVAEGYHPIQNEAHADFLTALVDESGAVLDAAGATHEGRRVFVTMKLPGYIKIGGCDPIENYLAVMNSHDGSMAFTAMVTPIRVVCKNTMNLAFRQNRNMIKLRHTKNANQNIQQVREALEITFDYLDEFQKEAEQLANATLTQSRFEEMMEAEFGAREGAAQAAVTRAQNKIDDLVGLFAEAGTQEGIRDTAWAGLNALVEWNDHFSGARDDDRRASEAVANPKFKNWALDLMLAEAGIRF